MNEEELLQLEKDLSKEIDPLDELITLTFKEAKEFFQFQKKEFMKKLKEVEKRIKVLEKKKHA